MASTVTRRRCLVGVLAVAAAGCAEQRAAPAPSESAPPPERPPAPRPHGVIGTAVAASPARLHGSLRSLLGDELGLASTYGATVTLLAGLPLTSAPTIDEAAPLRAVLWAPTSSEVELVAAVPLRAPELLLAQVSSGQAAPHRTRRDEEAGLDWVEPVAVDVPPSVAVAVARNHLVLGSSARAVAACGAYLAHPAPPELEPGSSALSVWLSRDAAVRAAGVVGERASAGRGPEWGALLGLLSSNDEVTRLSDARELKIDANLDGEALTLSVAVDTASAPPSACVDGPLSELTSANVEAALVFATFSDDATRRASAERAAGWLAQAGLAGGERGAKVKDALAAIARARGQGTRLAVELSEVGWLAYGSSDVTEPAAARDALEALRVALDAGADAKAGMELVASKAVVENVGEALRLRLRRPESGGTDAKPVATILARVHEERLVLSTGADPSYALLRELRASAGAASLAERGEVAALAARVDASATAFAYADLAALRGKPRGARLIASLRTCASPAVVRAAISHRAARELVDLLRARARP
ncbi:MAG: hypothetical protein IPG04_37685 [Polyangiaceae bacterium]|nr:hypothetical protein [Polyangiaceae bacterium]